MKQNAWGSSPTLTTLKLFPQQLQVWLCPLIWVLVCLVLLFLQPKRVPVAAHKAQRTIEQPLPKCVFVCLIIKLNWRGCSDIYNWIMSYNAFYTVICYWFTRLWIYKIVLKLVFLFFLFSIYLRLWCRQDFLKRLWLFYIRTINSLAGIMSI